MNNYLLHILKARFWGIFIFLLTLCFSGCSAKKNIAGDEQQKKSAKIKDKKPSLKETQKNPVNTKNKKQKKDKQDNFTFKPASQVILIVVDALRSDRIGAYGYTAFATTPVMDKLASQGILFEQFYAASPWTAASFGTILTGVNPTVHGGGHKVRGKTVKKIMGLRITSLKESISTLPQILPEFPKAAIMTNSFLQPALGFCRGFNHCDHQNAGLSKSRRADETTKDAVLWLKSIDNKKPFFLMVHYFDPHMSYDPPAKYMKEFASGPSGRIRAPFKNHADARNGKLNPQKNEKKFIRGLYNAEVRFTDSEIGVLYDYLKSSGLLSTAWVILTSDHGEEHFEHGSFDHGHRYENEVIKVPLIMRPPGGINFHGRVKYSCSHEDILPTILDLYGVEMKTEIQGRSLMPLITGLETKDRTVYMERNIYWKNRDALFDGHYKIIHDVDGKTGWMYDLKKDPLEMEKLDTSHSEYSRMYELLLSKRNANQVFSKKIKGEIKSHKLSEETIKSLKSLGYVN